MKYPYTDLESTIQQYVLGRMSEAEVEDFEDYYFDKPEIIEMIETMQNIHAGLQSSVLANDEDSYLNESSIFDKFVNLVSTPVPAYAFMAVLAGVLLLPNLLGDGNVTEPTLVHFSTTAMRSSTSAAYVDLSQVSGPTVIIIKLPSIAHEYHALQLIDGDTGKLAWTSDRFQVGSLNESLVFLPESLQRQRFELRVIGIRQDDTTKQVSFCHYSEACRFE